MSKTYQNNSSSLNIQLVKASLETLNTFLSWIPMSHIFMTDMIEGTIIPLLRQEYLITDCLKCLTEVFSLSFKGIEQAYQDQFKSKLLMAFKNVIDALNFKISSNKNFRMEREIIQRVGQKNKLVVFD